MNEIQPADSLAQLNEEFLAQQEQLEWEHMLLVDISLALAVAFLILLYLYHRYKNLKKLEKLERKTNEELLLLTNRLEALNKEKNEIFQKVIHDLKNPISGILGLSNLANTHQEDMTRGELLEFMDQIEMTSPSLNHEPETLCGEGGVLDL